MKVEIAGGEVINLGKTETAPTVGITDFSRRVTDEFGITTVVKRGFARRMSVRLAVTTADVDALQRRLADLRATPAIWTADDDFASLSFEGFYKSFELDLAQPPLSFCTLTVEGLASSGEFADDGSDPAANGPSTLQMLSPASVGHAELVSSSVAENDHAEWSALVSYAAGARVIKAATHRVYESLVAANLGHDPVAAEQWLEVGATNRFAMFDQALGSATSAASSIAVTIDVGAADALALLDVVGTAVRVQTTGYDQTKAVANGKASFFDLPGADAPISVTITGTGTVAVGTLLAGHLLGLGVTEASPSAGITDYSRKDADDFGDVSIVERAWAKRMAAGALIRSDAVDLVVNRIAAVRARPSLWIGDESLDALTVYGFFKDFSVEVGPNVSKLSVSIEGLSKAAPLAVPIPQQIAELLELIEAANLAAAGKSKWFYQGTPPTAEESAAGDYWINLADQSRTYRRVAGNRLAIGAATITLGGNHIIPPCWTLADDQRIGVLLRDVITAQHTADEKAKVFILTSAGDPVPLGEGVGDMLIRLYASPVQTDTWNGFAWVASATYGATGTQAAAIEASANAIAAIVSDNVLARGEKPQFAREWAQAQARYSAIDAKAATFGGVSALRATLTTKYGALAVAIAAITPPYTDASQDSPIVGTTLQTAWADFYVAYAALDMAITAQTVIAQWSVDGSTGWHSDPVEGDKWTRQSADGGATWSAPIKAVGEDGGDGAPGLNNATVFLFKRSPTAPSVPAASLTYTFATAVLSGSLGGWAQSIPAGADPLYVTAATAISASATDTIAPGEWAAPVIQAQDGATGPSGYSQATVHLYQRATSTPSVPSNTLTYTFATAELSGTINNGWSIAIPAGANPLYVTVATAYGNTATDTIAAGEWSGPVIFSQDGANGTAGVNSASVLLYQRAGAAPAVPAGSTTYTFATSVLSGSLGSWAQSIPAGTAPLWVTTATAAANTATDTIATGEWATPRQMAVNGISAANVTLYQRSATAPAVPGSTLTYTFATGALAGTLGAWSQAVPGGTEDLYVTQATALGTDAAATDTIATGEWSSPVIQARNGEHPSLAFKRSATQPTTPADTSTPPAGWADAPPAQTVPPTALWQTTSRFRNSVQLAAWSAPVKLIAADLLDLDPVAAELLAQARDIAAGKNKIFPQGIAPSAAESQPGDFWINIEDGHRTFIRAAGTGRIGLGGNTITLGGNSIELCWVESENARIGQALEEVAAAIALAERAEAKADAAIGLLEDAADDGILTADEKIRIIIPQDAQLEGAWAVLDAQAATFGVTTARTAAAAARTAWRAYRDGLLPAWNDATAATAVTRATFRSKLSDYAAAIDGLNAANNAAAATLATWDGLTGSGKDLIVADVADAKGNANLALLQIGVIQSDGWLSAGEKPDILNRLADIEAEYPLLVAKAVAQSVDTLTYEDAYDALIAYIATLSPAVTSTTTDTAIVPATFGGKFSDYYYARRALTIDVGDLTSKNQHSIPQIADVRVAANYLGVPASGALPKSRLVQHLVGTTDQSGASNITASATGGVSITVNNTPADDQRGLIMINDQSTLPAEATVTGVSTFNGQAWPFSFKVIREDAAPPTSGGGGGGSNPPGPPASDTSFTPPGSSSTHIDMSDVLTVKVGDTGEVSLSASLSFEAASQGNVLDYEGILDRTMAGKWMYSSTGTSGWADVGSEEAAQAAAQAYYSQTVPKGPVSNPGSCSVPRSKTGLTAGSWAYFKLVGRSTGGNITSVTGNAVATPQ